MKLEQIVSKVLEIPYERVVDDLSPENCAEWTSLQHIDLLVELESAYSLEFDIEESIDMDSVGAIREVLEARGIDPDA